jgi:LPXTG-motif cell wall-anchored protein
VVDESTNLNIKESSVEVKVSDTENKLTRTIYKTDENGNTVVDTQGEYTLEINGGVMTIVIDWGKALYEDSTNRTKVTGYTFKHKTGSVITITYTAEVDAGAASATDGKATNTVNITYNNGVAVNQTSDDTNKTEVKTSSFELKKISDKKDSEGKEIQLENAEFRLQKKDASGTYQDVTLVEETNGAGKVVAYHVADYDEINKVDDQGKKVTATTTKIVAGDVTIKGLDLDADYQIVEDRAPDGYNKLTAPVQLLRNTEHWVTDETTKVTTLEKTDAEVTSFQNMPIENATGSTLPSTGGTGTTVFYVVGGVLVLAALVVLITRKRIHMDD